MAHRNDQAGPSNAPVPGNGHHHHRIKDYTLDDNLPAIVRTKLQPKTTLGNLHGLPNEVMQDALIRLDLRSFASFCCVSKRALELAEGTPQLSEITTLGKAALRCLLKTNRAGRITCNDLYEKLCFQKCEACGDLGDFLYLLTFKRLCFKCLAFENHYMTVEAELAIRMLALTDEIFSELAILKYVPGCYSPGRIFLKEGPIVNSVLAHRISMKLYPHKEDLYKKLEEQEEEDIRQYCSELADLAFRKRRTEPPVPKPRRVKRLTDGRAQEPYRFVGTCRMPFFDRERCEVQWGFHCNGCPESRRLHHWRQKFAVSSFGRQLDPTEAVMDPFEICRRDNSIFDLED